MRMLPFCRYKALSLQCQLLHSVRMLCSKYPSEHDKVYNAGDASTYNKSVFTDLRSKISNDVKLHSPQRNTGQTGPSQRGLSERNDVAPVINEDDTGKVLGKSRYYSQLDMKHIKSTDQQISFETRNEDNLAYSKVRMPYKKKKTWARDLKHRHFQNQHIDTTVKGEILYGLYPCLMALQECKRQIHRIYLQNKQDEDVSPNHIIQEVVEIANDRGITVSNISKHEMNMLSKSKPKQGICMDVSHLERHCLTTDDLNVSKCGSPQVWIVLDQIQDPMNFGAVLRSCYFLGIERILTPQANSCPLSPVVSKASSGVLEIFPVHVVDDISQFLQVARRCGWDVIGTTASCDVNCDSVAVSPVHDFTITNNSLILLGNEGSGLDEGAYAHCNHLLRIPPGRLLNRCVDSLNVSVAAGVLLHQLMLSVNKSQ